jgi:hypothetical protein
MANQQIWKSITSVYRALAAQNEPSPQSWWNAPLSYRKRMDILRGAND